LVRCLRRSFAEDPRGCQAAECLRGYAASGSDWRDAGIFEPGAYTRNLIERNAEFELLLLCWGAGQSSPIHNHEGQNCWAAVMQGPLEEVRYRLTEPSRPGPPLECETLRYATREVMFIRDDIALHAVRATADGPAASLHLYAKPYAWCNVYCEETGRVTRMKLEDYSVRGHRL
jgi:cysteine dioxygenase